MLNGFFSVLVEYLGTEEPKKEAELKIFLNAEKEYFRAVKREIRIWHFQLCGAWGYTGVSLAHTKPKRI